MTLAPTLPMSAWKELAPGLMVEERGYGLPVLVLDAPDAVFRRVAQRARAMRPAPESDPTQVIATARRLDPSLLVVSLGALVPGAHTLLAVADPAVTIEAMLQAG